MEKTGQKSTPRSTQPCTNPDCKRIRENLQEEIRRLKSASYDLMKQTGDWQCGGRTHRDHSDAYDSFFLREVDDLTPELHRKTGMEEASARALLSHLFLKVYERCRGRVLDRMRTALSSVGSVSVGSGRNVREAEALHDTCRAYGLLLHSSQVRQVQEHIEVSSQIHGEMMRAQEFLSAAEAELEKFTNSVAEMSWGLLTTVPPLVCTQPSKYSFSYHNQENWDSSRGDSEMVYFRPVLFSSYEGRVAMKGWVTNRAMGRPIDIGGSESRGNEILSNDQKSDAEAAITDDKYSDFVVVSNEASSVQSVLADLLPPPDREGVADLLPPWPPDGEEGEESVEYETLSLLRLTNK